LNCSVDKGVVKFLLCEFQEIQRNTVIKDAMREQSVVQLTETWYTVLVSAATPSKSLACFYGKTMLEVPHF
jgi:hypothetical protein